MPRLSAVSSRLAAHAGVGQLEVLHAADRASGSADWCVVKLWRELWRTLKTTHGPGADYHRALPILRQVGPAITGSLRDRLAALYRFGHRRAVGAVVKSVPRDWLAVPLREDQGEPALGQVELTAQLFPAPTEAEVVQALAPLVHPPDWQALGDGTDRRLPEVLAQQIATGTALGHTQQEIARDIRPYFEGSRVRARRAARTFGLHVAHQGQMDAWAGLGDLSIGFQVHAVFDEHTRPLHAGRNGTVYYKQPVGEQLGLDAMPRPPLEADGSVAWHCRCWLTPVLRPAREIEDDPDKAAVFYNDRGKLVPDPTVYAEWFAQAPEVAQRKAVGSRRYDVVRSNLEVPVPAWADFLDPQTGGLLSTGRLKRETPDQRAIRVQDALKLLARLRGLIGQVYTFGFLPAETVS